MKEMLSLYDYLKKAAGAELGREVAKAAKDEGIRIDARYVTTKSYKGDILLYPKQWLDEYFSKHS